jgi:hypothetical protein
MWQERHAVGMGMDYCPDLDCFFAYNSGRASWSFDTRQTIWKIQPPATNNPGGNWTITNIDLTGMGDAVASPASGQGNYGRFCWVPAYKCFLIFNGPISGGRMYLYRPVGV